MSDSTQATGTVTERPVRLRNIIGFGIGDIYGGGAFLIIGMLFMFFLTEIVGMRPALAGLMFGAGKVWDAISDPLMGYLSDRTKSRFGRRRVYFLWGIVPIAITFALIWIPIRSDSQLVLFMYYVTMYMLLNTVLTLVMTPYSALPAEMSSDFKIRNRLSLARLSFSGLSSLLAAVLPTVIIGAFPGNPGRGHLMMGIIFGILFALPWIFVFLSTWENPVRHEPRKNDNFIKQFATIARNRSFRVHFLMYVMAYTAMDVLMALFTYYLTYYLGRPGLYSVAMGTLIIVQLAMMPVYTGIANKKGQALAYAIGLGVWVLGMMLTRGLSATSPTFALVAVCAVIGMGTSAGVLMPYAMLPFIIDVDELITGEQRSGVYAGAMTLMRKLVQGLLAMPAIGFMLQGIGFVSGAVQDPAILSKFFLFFIGVPGTLLVFGILASTRFRITPASHAVLRAELERLRAGGAMEAASPETIALCETLTGHAWASCWKRPS